MTAQETTNRTLWDAGFLFLGKTEKCRPSIRSPPSCGFQCCASIHPLQSSLLSHTHTHKVFVTQSQTQTGNNPLHEDVVEAFWLDSGPLLTTVYEAEELQTHKFQPNVKCKREGNFFLFLSFLLSFMERTECTEGNRQAGREWLKP